MKTKYFLIYVFVGIAFLAVSAWVFLSGGQNAKAIRAKYRLGSILIMATAMLSVASCSIIEGIIDDKGKVMCYDPVEPAPTEDIVSITLSRSANNEIKAGDIVKVEIKAPTSNKYAFRIYYYIEGTSTTLQRIDVQRTDLIVENPDDATFEVRVSEEIDYKGEAWIDVLKVVEDNPERLVDTAYGVMIVNFI